MRAAISAVWRRGGLFGYALIMLLLTSLGWAFQWGFDLGTELLAP